MLSSLSLQDKVGQLLMVGFHGLEPPQWVLDMLTEGQIGGVILFARNVESPAQLAKLTQTCHSVAKHPILIAIDQEGGIVARLREKEGFTESPGAMVLGAGDSEAVAEQVAMTLARELRALGINWNLAPVVDITHDINNPSVGTRSLGADKRRVSRLASAQIRGFQQVKVAASAKHFPGIGNTPIDTHHALAIIEDSLDALWEQDLVPFRSAVKAGCATVMVSHVTFSTIDDQYPATLSAKVTQELLRDEIGFQGVTCTDCMEMGAIRHHYGAEESAILAVLAGQDLVLFSHSFNDDSSLYPRLYKSLLQAVESERIPMSLVDEANARIKVLKEQVAITESPQLDQIHTQENIAIMQNASRAGIVLLRDDNDLLPITMIDQRKIGLIEFGSYMDTQAMESGEMTALAGLLQAESPHIACIGLKSTSNSDTKLDKARQLAKESDLLIIATRSAHINTLQLEISQNLIPSAKQVILLCLRNPYDVDILTNVGTVLCSCGDSAPSLRAIIDALLGKFIPTGTLPVNISG